MENTINHKASCPVCGKNLFRASPGSFVECYCPKCGSLLMISFQSEGISIKTKQDLLKR